jgi:hypothetical protein
MFSGLEELGVYFQIVPNDTFAVTNTYDAQGFFGFFYDVNNYIRMFINSDEQFYCLQRKSGVTTTTRTLRNLWEKDSTYSIYVHFGSSLNQAIYVNGVINYEVVTGDPSSAGLVPIEENTNNGVLILGKNYPFTGLADYELVNFKIYSTDIP